MISIQITPSNTWDYPRTTQRKYGEDLKMVGYVSGGEKEYVRFTDYSVFGGSCRRRSHFYRLHTSNGSPVVHQAASPPNQNRGKISLTISGPGH